MSRQGEVCNVCCDDKIEFISCVYCTDKACTSCYETFLLDRPQSCCMFCSKAWNHEFIQKNFRNGFVDGKYKVHKKKVIFEREKALFPDTQLEIEKTKEGEKIKEIINEKKKQIKKIKDEIFELEMSLRAPRNNEEKEEKETRTFNVFCAAKDCKGFLNNKYICGLCETKHCKECRVILDEDDDEEEHKCDPNTVATIKALQKETKPCPKCATPIFKIEGCDQMWCTQCHTAFSWKHGRIETGHVHNPHYWQYLQKQGKDLDAVRRMERGQHVVNRCETLQDAYATMQHRGYGEICRLFTHIFNYDLPRITVPDYVTSNFDIRKKFLLNEIDEKHFKTTLHAREKKALYTGELRQIVQMYYDVGKDILLKAYRLYTTNSRTFNASNRMNEIFKELNELSEYTNTQIENLSERFNYRVKITEVSAILRVAKISGQDSKNTLNRVEF